MTSERMDSGLVDLHIHTSISDGTYSPSEVVALARKEDLKAVAITDHDAVDGNEEAMEAGKKNGVEVIPGVEISVEWKGRAVHILGYYIDWANENLSLTIGNLIRFREERNPRIIEKLNLLGLDVSYEEVKCAAGIGTIGRPHFAQVLIEKGYVRTGDEAFRKYLQKGAAAYVDKKRLTPEEGIQLIKDAGGIPIVAHPFIVYGMTAGSIEDFIVDFQRMGIQGLEAFYTTHSPQQTLQLMNIAEKHGLFLTGGSDFHGAQKPNVGIGRGYGNLRVPYELVQRLRQG